MLIPSSVILSEAKDLSDLLRVNYARHLSGELLRLRLKNDKGAALDCTRSV